MQRSPQWFALFHTFEDPSILFERSIVDVYVILSALGLIYHYHQSFGNNMEIMLL